MEAKDRRINFWGLFMALCISLLFASCSGMQKREPETAKRQTRVERLLSQFPTDNQREGRSICSRLLNTGPKGILEICDHLVPVGTGDDAAVRFALNGMTSCVMQPKASEKKRLMFAVALGQALQAETSKDIQSYLLYQLQFVAKDESVEVVSNYLADDVLCDPAVAVLLNVGSPRAIAELAQALPAAKGKNRVSITLALGELGVEEVVQEIKGDATSEDAALRKAARYAAANIGSPVCLDLFLDIAREESESTLKRAELASLCLHYASRLAEREEAEGVTRICRVIIDTRTRAGEENVQSAALTILTKLKGEGALPDLLAAMASPDAKSRRVALDLAQALPGKKVTTEWLEKMKQSSPEVQAEIIAMLGRRGDKVVLPAILAAFQDEDEGVRLSAIDASVNLAGMEVLPQLLSLLQTAQAAETKKVEDVLSRMSGDKVVDAVAKALPDVPSSARAALIELLARRQAKQYLDTVFTYTGDENRSVRIAAIKAIETLADEASIPRMIDILLSVQSSSEQAAARKTVVTLCRMVPNPENQADALLTALENTKEPKQKAVLMKAIAQLGTEKGLSAVVAEVNNTDKDIRDGAIRALAEWDDISAASAMMDVAKQADSLVHRILALKGYIRVVGESKLSADEKLDMYRKALAIAERPDEKRQVLSALAEIKTLASLKLVGDYLDDNDLRKEAAMAAVSIAVPQKENEEGLIGAETCAILGKSIASIDDETLKRQVKEYVAILWNADEDNLALGKPVKASVEHQVDFTAEKAVDGDRRKHSHWDGKSWPCWFQVDLTEPQTIESVHIQFYWDEQRYCQYTVEVSTDEQNWVKVADRSKTKDVSTYRGDLHVFDPIVARYVRINILKNSANAAAHIVEIGVYAKGKTPTHFFAPEFDDADFTSLFNGRDLTGWTGNIDGYGIDNGTMVVQPDRGGGNLYTADEYSDFIMRFEFKLTPGANNGLGIRAPLQGDAAFVGMELQILDNTADQYKNLKPYQYHGSIYGVVPAKRGCLKPVGEWNCEEVIARGRQITVKLNGHTIVDADIDKASEGGTVDGRNHPGLKRTSGHIGFLGHGSRVEFRNLRIKDLAKLAALDTGLSEAEYQEGFQPLFDGKSLTGWEPHTGLPDGVGGKWTVEEGTIKGVQDPPGKGGFLTTKKEYRDFDLRLESKIDWPFDSGVFLRVGPHGKSHQVTLDYRPGGEVGGIYCPWTHGFVSHCTEGADLWKKDEWNDLRIVCEGEPARIRVWVNDRLITDFQHTEETTEGVPAVGTLCLQVHPGGKDYDKGKALFRNIRIRELARD